MRREELEERLYDAVLNILDDRDMWNGIDRATRDEACAEILSAIQHELKDVPLDKIGPY